VAALWWRWFSVTSPRSGNSLFMAWFTPTSETLRLRMAADWAPLTRAAQQNGVTMADVASGVIGDVVDLVRGFIQGNPDNTMGAEGSIPSEASHSFYTLARLAIIATIPGGTALADEVRKEMHRTAVEHLSKMADGTIRIAPPDDAAASQPDTATGVCIGDAPLEWGDERIEE
jgi:hypothetical protein